MKLYCQINRVEIKYHTFDSKIIIDRQKTINNFTIKKVSTSTILVKKVELNFGFILVLNNKFFFLNFWSYLFS